MGYSASFWNLRGCQGKLTKLDHQSRRKSSRLQLKISPTCQSPSETREDGNTNMMTLSVTIAPPGSRVHDGLADLQQHFSWSSSGI